MEDLLAENDQSRAASAEDVGPETELEYWRSRMGKLNSITEQLRGKDCKVPPRCIPCTCPACAHVHAHTHVHVRVRVRALTC